MKHWVLLCSFPGPFSVLQPINYGYVLTTHGCGQKKKKSISVLPWSLCTHSTMVIWVCLFSLETGAKLGTWYAYITGYGHSTNRPGHHGTVVARTVGSNASCHSHSLENATHLAGTGVQVLIYMGQMQPASSSIRWSVDARCDSHTDFHLQQKIEFKSGFHGNDYKKVVYLV